MPADTFGVRLMAVRRRLGLTQEAIAELCGIDDGSWSNWERGTKPRAMNEVVDQICRAIRVDRDWLMWGTQGSGDEGDDSTPRIHVLGGSTAALDELLDNLDPTLVADRDHVYRQLSLRERDALPIELAKAC